MNHASGLLGCVMLVHGGFSTEAKRILDDFSLLDLELMHWVDTKVFINGTLYSEKQHSKDMNLWPGPKQSHTITAIFDKAYY